LKILIHFNLFEARGVVFYRYWIPVMRYSRVIVAACRKQFPVRLAIITAGWSYLVACLYLDL